MDAREGKPDDVSDVAWASGDAWMPRLARAVLDKPVFTVLGADVNGWTGVHAMAGYGFGRVGIDFGASLAIHEGWEQWQTIIGMSGTGRADMVDRLLDTTSFVVGWVAAKALNR